MPVVVKAQLSSEDSFEEMMVLSNTGPEAEAIIQNWLQDNDGAQVEVAAGQYLHVGNSITTDEFEIIELDTASAEFLVQIMGGDTFGTGVLSSIFGE